MVIRRTFLASVFLALALLAALIGAARADGLRLVVPDVTPVAGEMVPVTVRGEYDSVITLEKLIFPDSPDYDWIQLARDRWWDERIDGRMLKVFERKIAVYPRRAGMLVIGPVVHHLTVVGRDRPREPLDVVAERVRVQVAPFPAEGEPLAARALEVTDELSAAPGALRDGETLARRVVIRAEGALPHQLPPRPAMRAAWLITFAAPEERKVDLTPDGPVTTVTWLWNLRPKTGEPGVLPAFAIPWFDTGARTLRKAEIAAIPFGYASFRAGHGGADRLPPGKVAVAAAATGAGFTVGLAVAVAGLSLRRRAGLATALRRLVPVDLTRAALRRAGRGGDLLAVRRAAERHLRRRAALGRPVDRGVLAPLDAALYGVAGPALTPAAAAELVLRGARRRPRA